VSNGDSGTSPVDMGKCCGVLMPNLKGDEAVSVRGKQRAQLCSVSIAVGRHYDWSGMRRRMRSSEPMGMVDRQRNLRFGRYSEGGRVTTASSRKELEV
jgi:hypothetical protein